MSTLPLNDIQLDEHEQVRTELAPLVEQGFTPQEIATCLRLRQSYQDGGSDRVPVVRKLEFLRYLVRQGILHP